MSKYNVGVYIRLSRDDNYSDSNSIDNQIKLIEFYCKNNDLKIAEKYIDNGYSGTNFDWPSFQKLLKEMLYLKYSNLRLQTPYMECSDETVPFYIGQRK